MKISTIKPDAGIIYRLRPSGCAAERHFFWKKAHRRFGLPDLPFAAGLNLAFERSGSTHALYAC